MLSLQNFFRLGVRWVGPDADKLRSRHVRVVLEHLARKIKPDRPHAGVKLTPADLSDGLYQRRNAASALASLVKAGVITRTRARADKSLHEDVARSFINPDLLEASAEWNGARSQRRRHGKRGQEMNPDAIDIKLPMALPICCIENPPNSPPPSGDPYGIRPAEDPACKKYTQQHAKNAQTGIPLPPQASEDMGNGAAGALAVPAVKPQAAAAAARGGSGYAPGVKPPGTHQQSTMASFLKTTEEWRQEKAGREEKIDPEVF